MRMLLNSKCMECTTTDMLIIIELINLRKLPSLLITIAMLH